MEVSVLSLGITAGSVLLSVGCAWGILQGKIKHLEQAVEESKTWRTAHDDKALDMNGCVSRIETTLEHLVEDVKEVKSDLKDVKNGHNKGGA